MAVRRPTDEPTEPPEGFRRALASLRGATVRPEVILDETPAPQRLAPYAVALSAEVRHGDEDLATGRLVVLYDPQGQEAWAGPTRVVAYVRAACELEMAADPLLPGVGWSWLVEALEAHGATFTAASGTVTRVASESFGGMVGTPASAEVEIRASWSPLDDQLALHLEGWADLLCHAAGLPPLPPGVATIKPARARKKR
ncbi:MAG: hypothetical protein QOG53_808 [Frankiales bacterium]|jgi:hypothetical protein|nr:hypothetical protein [Frankiales bacterium]